MEVKVIAGSKEKNKVDQEKGSVVQNRPQVPVARNRGQTLNQGALTLCFDLRNS